jgi:Transcriptional regulator PadR-like family
MLILQTLVLSPAHGQTIAHAIERGSEEGLQVKHGSLYPALHRLLPSTTPSTESRLDRCVLGNVREQQKIDPHRRLQAKRVPIAHRGERKPSGDRDEWHTAPIATESGDWGRTSRRRPGRFARIGRERLIRALIWPEYWGTALKKENRALLSSWVAAGTFLRPAYYRVSCETVFRLDRLESP